MSNSLEAPGALLATHDRLRKSGFSIVSVICARTSLDAKVWLGSWAAERNRAVVAVPETTLDAVFRAYVARVPTYPSLRDDVDVVLPLLMLPGTDLKTTLPVAATLAEREHRLPIVLTCDLPGIVEHLLNTTIPLSLVSVALQGLVPVAQAEQQVLKTVAEGRQLTPFLRGACEGLVFYMLEARPETRGRFLPNQRVNGTKGKPYEVDIFCAEAKLIIEIDGPEHKQIKRQSMDERKSRDLEAEGHVVRRFGNEQVINDPVGVWKLITEQLTRITNALER